MGGGSNRISFFVLCATVALAPLPFGSTDPASAALWCVTLGVAAALASVQNLRTGQVALVWLLALVVAAGGFVLHEQLAAYPWSAAPPHEIWAAASVLLGRPLAPTVSIARNQPWFALGGILSSVLSLLVGFVLGADRRRAHALMRFVAIVGALYAALAIVLFLTDPDKVLWRDKQAHQGFLTGTFMNRNTAAVYFGGAATLWLLFACERVKRRMGEHVRWKLLTREALRPSRALVTALTLLLLCLTAMFMTGSRAGVILSLAGMVIAFAAYFHRDLPGPRGVLIFGVLAFAVAVLLFQVIGGGSRLDMEGLAAGGRLSAYRSTLRIIGDHPWLGTGLGTFVFSFPEYRGTDMSMIGIWDRTHNTLLELASDLGLPLAGVIVVGWGVIAATLVTGVRRRQRDLAIPSAALAIGLIAVLHAMVDFSLQIPGFAITVFAIIGAGLAQSFRTGKSQAVPSRRSSTVPSPAERHCPAPPI